MVAGARRGRPARRPRACRRAAPSMSSTKCRSTSSRPIHSAAARKGDREKPAAGAQRPGGPGQMVAGQRQVERDVDPGRVLGLRVPDDLVGAEARSMSASASVAVAITRAPAAASSGSTAVPTPPVAPTTRTVSPGRIPAVAISASAVRPTVASAAACSSGSPAGRCARSGVSASKTAYSASEPVLSDGPGGPGHRPQRPGHRLAEDLVARPVGGHAGADLADRAGEVVAGHVRKLPASRRRGNRRWAAGRRPG